MTKSPVIERHRLRHAVRVASITGQNAKRDVALLLVLCGTGLTPNEIAKLQVSDYLLADVRPVAETTSRPEIAFNGKRRPLLWASQKICAAVDDYLQSRWHIRQGVTTSPAAFRCLDPSSPLFLTAGGEPFSFTLRNTPSGAVSYSCERLARNRASTSSLGRRRAWGRQRSAPDFRGQAAPRRTLIQQLIGVSSLAAVKRLIDGEPVKLASMVSGLI